MIVYSIDPNTNKYFEDTNQYVYKSSSLYLGMYNLTPIYPHYTFIAPTRLNYNTPSEIRFITMLPINKVFGSYLVEVQFKATIDIYNPNSLIIIIDKFNEYCRESKQNINIKSLIENEIVFKIKKINK